MSKENRIPLKFGYPEKTGLYDPSQEKDSCGVGFVANIKGQPSHQIMLDAYHLNSRMDHRGGCGFEANSGGRCRTASFIRSQKPNSIPICLRPVNSR